MHVFMNSVRLCMYMLHGRRDAMGHVVSLARATSDDETFLVMLAMDAVLHCMPGPPLVQQSAAGAMSRRMTEATAETISHLTTVAEKQLILNVYRDLCWHLDASGELQFVDARTRCQELFEVRGLVAMPTRRGISTLELELSPEDVKRCWEHLYGYYMMAYATFAQFCALIQPAVSDPKRRENFAAYYDTVHKHYKSKAFASALMQTGPCPLQGQRSVVQLRILIRWCRRIALAQQRPYRRCTLTRRWTV